MTERRREVIVMGGGISGLTVAWLLRRAGVDVGLIEASPRVGGCAKTVRKNGFLLEQGPFNVLVRDPCFEELLCGVEGPLTVVPAAEAAKTRYIYRQGRLHVVPTNPVKLMTTGLLSLRGRARLLRGLCWSKPPREAEETFEQVVSRRLGPEVADTIVSAAINGILAGDISKLTLAACFPTVDRMDREMRSPIAYGIRKALRRPENGPPRHKRKWRGMVSVTGGLGALMDALAVPIGDDCLTNCRVQSIERVGDGYELNCERLADGHTTAMTMPCRRIVVALPAAEAGHVLANGFPQAAQHIQSIESSRLVVLNLAYRTEDVGHPLRGFGFLVPRNEPDYPIMGALWADSVFPDQAREGHRLIRVFIGGAAHPEAVDLPDGDLLARATDAMGDLLQIHREPVLMDTVRYHAAIPQYHAGHGERIQRFRQAIAQHDGLSVVGNYLDGVSLNDCVRVATRCAHEIIAATTARCAPGEVTKSKDVELCKT